MSIKSLCSKHTVTHYSNSPTVGTAGSLTPSQTVGAVHTCFIQPVSANDRLVASQFETEISHVIFYDHDPGLTPGDEIKYGTRVFEITSEGMNVVEADRLWQVYAVEKDRDQS